MEEIETKVRPEVVWQAWQKAHELHTNDSLALGKKGKTQKDGAKGLSYKIIEVQEGESFTIVWKSLFARLIFIHTVKPQNKGALIQYSFQIKGPFAWFLRWMLSKKIQNNLKLVLKSMVKELEKSYVENHSRFGF